MTYWEQLCVEYWTEFSELVKPIRGPVHPCKPFPQAWYGVAIGSSRSCNLYAGIEYRKINVRLEVWGESRSAHFQLLHAQKPEIEAELGGPLDWRPLPNRERSRIVLKRSGGDLEDRADWPAQHQWLLEKLTAFHNVFGPRVRKLDASP